MERFLEGLITAPVGRAGIRVEGWTNPSKFLDRTIINRGEAQQKLVGHKIDLVIPPELKALISSPKSNPKGRAKTIFPDPYIQLSPKLEVHYKTQEYLDPKTGLPKVYMKKGKEKSGAARDEVFYLENSAFFSKTSKMSAPSFSLPAGPQLVGGTCVAADVNKRPRNYEIALTQGDVEQTAPRPKDWICSYCYAGKSNYMHRTSQYTQTARLMWLEGMLDAHGIDGTADVMVEAIRAHMANAKARASMKEATDFFRIHDSGDLVPNTYLMWRIIAKKLGGISFWCPTRMWVLPKFNELVRKNPPPTNLTLRPSALHFGDRAPIIEGYSGGSTAHPAAVDPVKTGIAEWSCPAYEHDGKSCAGGGGPNGEKDCRFCWSYKADRPSYRSH